jgi:hypothetical protein
LQDKVNVLDREITKLRAQLEMDSANVTDEQKRAVAVKKNVKEVSKSRVRDLVGATVFIATSYSSSKAYIENGRSMKMTVPLLRVSRASTTPLLPRLQKRRSCYKPSLRVSVLARAKKAKQLAATWAN